MELTAEIRRTTGTETPSVEEVRSAILKRIGPNGELDLPPDWANGSDVLGEAYESLVASVHRRRLGQFQTPFDVADVMAGWLCQEPIETLLDPAVGSGRLLFRTQRAGEINQVVGLDVDPLAVAMARTNLRSRGHDGALHCADFLTDDDALRRIGLATKPPDAVIANPPYSRHQELSSEQKELLHARAFQHTGMSLSRRTGLHAFFLLRALEVAEDGARLAFITPSGWLNVSYGVPIRRFLATETSVESIVAYGPDQLVFPRASTTAAILFIRKQSPAAEQTRVVYAKRSSQAAEILDAVRGEQTNLRSSLVDLRDGSLSESRKRRRLPRKGIPLHELARVRRGVATGNNDFFVISEARRRRWKIDELLLRGCLARPQLFPMEIIVESTLDCMDESSPRWILSSPLADHHLRDDGFGRYLRWGIEEADADRSHLAQKRAVWHQPEERDSCSIVVACTNRKSPRFIWNQTGAVALNSFHIIEPHDEAAAERIWRSLNHQTTLDQLESVARPYGGGMWKLEPRGLKQLRIVLR